MSTNFSLPSFSSIFNETFYETTLCIAKEFPDVKTIHLIGKWSELEEKLFNHALSLYGLENVESIQEFVKTRTKNQIRNRVQKVKEKLKKDKYENTVKSSIFVNDEIDLYSDHSLLVQSDSTNA